MRVLQVLTRPNLGGAMRHLLAVTHAAPTDGQLLAVGRCRGEPEILDPELPEVPATEVTPESRGVVRIDRLERAVQPYADFLARRRLQEVIQRFRPDVVHTHTSKAGLLGRQAAWAEQVPVVAHTFHGHVLRDHFGAVLSTLLRLQERRLARRTNLLFSVSESCSTELRELGIGRDHVVVPPAVDLAPFWQADRERARQQLGLAATAQVIGFVGRLVPIKRPAIFAQVVQKLRVQGMVFGDGELRSELEGYPGLRLFGAVSELAPYLAAIDVLVLPSKREGLPLAAIEARAAGVPVVGFDVPGVRDALGPPCYAEPGHHLVPERDGAAGLARAVATLLTDRAAWQRARDAGRRGLEVYAPEQVAAEIHQHYVAAIAKAKARTATA